MIVENRAAWGTASLGCFAATFQDASSLSSLLGISIAGALTAGIAAYTARNALKARKSFSEHSALAQEQYALSNRLKNTDFCNEAGVREPGNPTACF